MTRSVLSTRSKSPPREATKPKVMHILRQEPMNPFLLTPRKQRKDEI